MNLEYVMLRLVRKWMPPALYNFLLRRGIGISAGLETTDPAAAVERYAQALAAHGFDLAGKAVMDFGYGGYLGTAVALAQRGAAHVFLCDKYAALDHARNAALLPRYSDYLRQTPGGVQPDPARFTLIHQDLRDYLDHGEAIIVDVVLSSSVFEHIQRAEIAATTASLRAITAPEGVQVHFIDLRDHYFKYPFQMYTYAEPTWRRFLNPGVNLNRLRVPDYVRLFEAHFGRVTWEATERNLDAFRAVKDRIRPEFLAGDDALDAVMQMVLVAWPA